MPVSPAPPEPAERALAPEPLDFPSFPPVAACVDVEHAVERDPAALRTRETSPPRRRKTKKRRGAARSSSTRRKASRKTPKKAIARVIESDFEGVRACYGTGLEFDESLEGTVVIVFVIGPSGDVETSRVQASSLDHPATEHCVAGRACAWSFPPPRGGSVVRVTYPFVFATASPDPPTVSRSGEPPPEARWR
ncbi:MAG: AgmX/PglI C-terminal domain-containing protein [Myxococcota bacterium]